MGYTYHPPSTPSVHLSDEENPAYKTTSVFHVCLRACMFSCIHQPKRVCLFNEQEHKSVISQCYSAKLDVTNSCGRNLFLLITPGVYALQTLRRGGVLRAESE